MSSEDKLINWKIDSKPPVMTKQFTFESYDQTRLFVNELADLSEKTGYYPNLTFSKSNATVTIYTEDSQLSEKDFQFAEQTDLIAQNHVLQDLISND